MAKVAVISGASSGIGAGIARYLAGKGLHCVLVARRKDKLEEVKQDIVKAGGTASVYPCDTTDKNQVKKLSSGVVAAIGAPDILINNAGVAIASQHTVEADYDGWDKMIDVNIRSHLYMLGEFLPGMKERGSGHVVNITSEAEKEPWGIGVYCGTKHFWTGMSDALRQELVGTEIKVTNVQPGFVDTDMVRGAVDALEKMVGMNPGTLVSTMLTPEDIAKVVWETVSRPGRCYQRDVMITDMGTIKQTFDSHAGLR